MKTAVLQRRRLGGFNPASPFSSGEDGGVYVIKPEYCWQNAAGTIAAGVGDPVRRVDDLSGNNNHALQSVSSARPTLRQSGSAYYLEFDGIDDFYPVAASGLLGTTWSHVGAWSADQGAHLFSTSETFRGAARQVTTAIGWVDEDDNRQDIAACLPNEKCVLSIDRIGNTSLSGRANGGAATTIVPYDNTSDNPGGLYISSSETDRYVNSGPIHWYGSVWISRVFLDTERQNYEALFADLSGVSI